MKTRGELPRAEAKVDGIKDRGLAAVTRSDQAIYPRPRQLAKAFDRPKVVDFNYADQRHTASPQIVRRPEAPMESVDPAAPVQTPVSLRTTRLSLTYNANALHGMA